MLQLDHDTPGAWVEAVLADFDAFLRDHAANERKAAVSALRLAVHHHDVPVLVDAMIDVAREELDHFRQVYDLIASRGAELGQDAPDPYMTRLYGAMRKNHKSEFLLDRLLVFALIEARGCERFAMLADALDRGPLKDFYAELTRAEARHTSLFTRLARDLFDAAAVTQRSTALIAIEAEISRSLPPRPSLH